MERTCKSTQRADVLSEGRELPMRGLGKFFLGGLLGAILGFHISPRRCKVVRDAWHRLGEIRQPRIAPSRPPRKNFPNPRIGSSLPSDKTSARWVDLHVRSISSSCCLLC